MVKLTVYAGKKFLKKKKFFINRLIKFYEIDNARVFTNTNHVSFIKDNNHYSRSIFTNWKIMV